VSFLYDDALFEALERVYGEDLDSFLDAVSRPGSRLYFRVNTLRIDPGELIDSLRARGLDVRRDEELPEALYVPVQGPFEIERLELCVLVDKRAAESILLGANLYAPGVRWCDPRIRRGDEVSILGPGGILVANGIAAMSCEEMLRSRHGLAVEVVRSRYRAPCLRSLPEFEKGLIYPQSLPAIYVSRILDPQPNDLVVDMCAAPGGKTGHIVELSRGRATIYAFDHSKSKIEELRNEMRRLGHLDLVHVERRDSRYLHLDLPTLRPTKVLVDPPCTALGVRPKVLDVKTWRDVVSSARYQVQFLWTALRIARVGARIVYSTCTVTVEENELLVELIAEKCRCVEIEKIEVRRFSRGVWGAHSDSYVRVHPHLHDATGYFIASLRKICDEIPSSRVFQESLRL